MKVIRGQKREKQRVSVYTLHKSEECRRDPIEVSYLVVSSGYLLISLMNLRYGLSSWSSIASVAFSCASSFLSSSAE